MNDGPAFSDEGRYFYFYQMKLPSLTVTIDNLDGQVKVRAVASVGSEGICMRFNWGWG